MTDYQLNKSVILLAGLVVFVVGRFLLNKKWEDGFTFRKAEWIGIGILMVLLLIITVVYS